jgi:hypothetical protein
MLAFLKLKSYLRFTISQERLINDLAFIAIENVHLKNIIKYEDLIDEFASKIVIRDFFLK